MRVSASDKQPISRAARHSSFHSRAHRYVSSARFFFAVGLEVPGKRSRPQDHRREQELVSENGSKNSSEMIAPMAKLAFVR